MTDLTKASEALRAALVRGLQDDEVGLFDGELSDRLDAYAEAVRSDTLADVAARLPELRGNLQKLRSGHGPLMALGYAAALDDVEALAHLGGTDR